MIVVFKDTSTGCIVQSDYPFDIYWWSEGNGACDCNRAALFEDRDIDCGDSPYRYIAIDILDHPDTSIQSQLDDINSYLGTCTFHSKEDIISAINNGLY